MTKNEVYLQFVSAALSGLLATGLSATGYNTLSNTIEESFRIADEMFKKWLDTQDERNKPNAI